MAVIPNGRRSNAAKSNVALRNNSSETDRNIGIIISSNNYMWRMAANVVRHHFDSEIIALLWTWIQAQKWIKSCIRTKWHKTNT